jgi:hypothetical protein
MRDESPIANTTVRRRETVALPKRRKHVALAALFLFVAFSIPILLSALVGQQSDAEVRGSVLVEDVALVETPSPLDRTGDALPDLLAGVTAVGENPTAIGADVDALGNPINADGGSSIPENAKDDRPVRTIQDPVTPPLDPTLTRNSPFGPIPGPNRAGLTPFKAYQAPRPDLGNRQPVSLVVGGLGVNPALTDRAIRELPANVSLSFAAGSENLQDWIDKARAYGHEVYLEIPMQAKAPASNASERLLSPEKEPQANRRDLKFFLAKAQGYAGLTHYQGEAVLQRADVSGPILNEIKASGLAFFTDGSFNAPSLGPLAETIGLPYRAGYGLIDPVADRSVIDERLNTLSKTASERPNLIGVGFAYPQTIDAVKGWAATLSADNLILVPVSAAIQP